MSNKCVIKYNENGGVDGVDIKNPSYFPQTEIENVKLELSNRQIAEKQASEKAKRAIEHVNSETAKTRTSKAVWESVAETWAKENDFWIEDYEEGHSYATQGGEHIVYTEDGNTETIRKVNHDIDDLSDWYKNLLDFNQLFPNTGYEIVGFTRLKKNYYAEGSYNQGIGTKGNFSVVVKQNFIPNKQIITQEEIQNYLEYLGFERMGTSNDYQQGDIILGDMNVDNVIKDRDGNYHVIDAYVDIEESETNNLKEELEQILNIEKNQVDSVVDLVTKVYSNVAKRLGITLSDYKRIIAFKTVQSVSNTLENLPNSLQNLKGLSNEFISNFQDGTYEEKFQGTYGEVEKKYIKNSGFKEGDYVLNSLMSLDDYFKFLGYESIRGMGRKKILVELETRLQDILRRANETNDFYIKEISKSFLENGLKRSQNQLEQDVYNEMLKGNGKIIEEQLKSFQNTQKNALLSSLNYLVQSNNYSLEFKYIMIGLVLKGNIIKPTDIEVRNKEGVVTGTRIIKGEDMTRGDTTVGNHQELSSMVLPNVYNDIINGSLEHPMKLVDKYTDKSYITYEETQEIIKDRIFKKQDDGVWVKFEQSDSEVDIDALTKVSKKVAKVMKENPWCTGGGMSSDYLPKGDFYLFLDNSLEPKITIRYEQNQIVELKGIDSGQALETSQIDNASEFLKEIPRGEEYQDQLDLFTIKKKLEEGVEFTEDDYEKFKRTYNKRLETYDSELKTIFDNMRIDKLKNSDVLKSDEEFINSIRSIDKLVLEDISILKNSDIVFAISINDENYSKIIEDYILENRNNISNDRYSNRDIINYIFNNLDFYKNNKNFLEEYYGFNKNQPENIKDLTELLEKKSINKIISLINHYPESVVRQYKYDKHSAITQLLINKLNEIGYTINENNEIIDAISRDYSNKTYKNIKINSNLSNEFIKDYNLDIIRVLRKISIKNIINVDNFSDNLKKAYDYNESTLEKDVALEYFNKFETGSYAINNFLEKNKDYDVEYLVENLNKTSMTGLFYKGDVVKSLSNNFINNKLFSYLKGPETAIFLKEFKKHGRKLSDIQKFLKESSNHYYGSITQEDYNSFGEDLKNHLNSDSFFVFMAKVSNLIIQNQDYRGVILKADKASLILFDKLKADVTTPIHEISHEYERVLDEYEIESLENWSGHKQGTTEFSEAFAKGFEKYIYEGSTFNSDVDGIFERFANWFRNIIEQAIDYFSDINELNDEVKDIYAKMVADGKTSFINKPTENLTQTEEEIVNSPLYESLKQNPLLTEEQALEIYKQSFSVQLEDWDTLDLNC